MQQASIRARAPSITFRFITTATALALVAGCQAAGGGDATRATPPSSGVQLIERDIEAPEVFQTEDRALWDGRPSLGGVWVASPNVTDPERVIIRNPETGKFVVGALFRRERVNPGPPLQLSSDAATALGVLAGAPVTLEVVALRREELPDPEAPAVAAAPVPEVEDVVAAADAVSDGVDDVAAGAAAAVAAAAMPDAEAALPLEAEVPGGVEVDVLTIAARAVWEAEEAKRLAAEAAAAEVELPAEGAAPAAIEASALDAPAGDPLVSVETDVVDPVVTIEEPATEATPRRGLRGLFGRRAAAPAAPLPDAVTQAVAAGVDGTAEAGGAKLVQVGVFTDERNAQKAADDLARGGIMSSMSRQLGEGGLWRITVGPAPTEADAEAVIRRIKDLGYPDAYAVAG